MSYPWKSLSPKDVYTVVQATEITDVDQRVLTALYQPLIGSSAMSLYLVWKDSVQHEKMLADLLGFLDVGIQEFYRARVRLEAVGLLRSYKQKEGTSRYLYEILPPLSAQVFFEDAVFSLLLYERVGEKTFHSLRETFLPASPSKEGFQEVTRSFLDVFHFQPTQEQQEKMMEWTTFSISNGSNQSVTQKKASWGTENSTFDWKFFIEGLNKHFVKSNSINQESKETILMLHEMYGVDEITMQRQVLEASDVETGAVNVQRLKERVHGMFHEQHPGKVSVSDSVENTFKKEKKEEQSRRQQLLASGFSSSDLSVIEASEELAPMPFLQSIKEQKGGFVTRPEQWTLEDIMSQSNLPASVVNILIHYILVIKNSPVFDRNLAYKIANDWAQQHIASPEAAIQKVKELRQASKQRLNQNRSKNTYRNNKKETYRKETLPNWAKEDRSNKEEKPLDKKEQDAFKERLRKIRSYRKEGDQ